MTQTADHDRELIAALRAGGHRVTAPRLAVHRHLRRQPEHVTAEQVHRDLATELPGLSLATVYATLDLLAGLQLVRRMSTPLGVALFDSRVEPHHHLLCRSCGAIVDVSSPVDMADARAAAEAQGFRVEHGELQLTGLCAACAAAGSSG